MKRSFQIGIFTANYIPGQPRLNRRQVAGQRPRPAARSIPVPPWQPRCVLEPQFCAISRHERVHSSRVGENVTTSAGQACLGCSRLLLGRINRSVLRTGPFPHRHMQSYADAGGRCITLLSASADIVVAPISSFCAREPALAATWDRRKIGGYLRLGTRGPGLLSVAGFPAVVSQQ